MGKTYHQLWIHVVWATKEREPVLNSVIRRQLFTFLSEYSDLNNYGLDVMNGVSDHVHCLLNLRPAISLSEIMHGLKGASSNWINEQKLTENHFRWQRGFSAFSVSKQNINKVRQYILNQETHHADVSFETELEKMGETFL